MYYAQDTFKVRYYVIKDKTSYDIDDYGEDGFVEKQFRAKDFWVPHCPEFNSEISEGWEMLCSNKWSENRAKLLVKEFETLRLEASPNAAG